MIENEWFVRASAIGISWDDFWKMNPHIIKLMIKSHKEEVAEQNYMMWLNGRYVADAIMSTIGNSPWFKGKASPLHKYPKEPYRIFGNAPKNMTADEKQREVDKFFAQESVRRANWKRTSEKQELGGE